MCAPRERSIDRSDDMGSPEPFQRDIQQTPTCGVDLEAALHLYSVYAFVLEDIL
jgi:hypothetical protein